VASTPYRTFNTIKTPTISPIFVSGMCFLVALNVLFYLLTDTIYTWLHYLSLFGLLVAVIAFFTHSFSFSTRLNSHFNLLELPIFLSFTVLFWEGLFGVIGVVNPDYIADQVNGVQGIFNGLLLAGIGLVVLWMGYAVVYLDWRAAMHRRERAASTQPQQQDKPYDNGAAKPAFTGLSRTRTFTVYGVLVALRIVLTVSGFLVFGGENFGEFQQILNYITATNVFFLSIFCYWAFTGQMSTRFLLIFVLVEVGFQLFAGWSGRATDIVIFVLALYFLFRGRLPILLLVGGVFAFSVIVPVIRESRQIDDRLTFIQGGVQATTFEAIPQRIEATIDLILERQSGLLQTYSVVQERTPQIVPYRDFEEVVLSPFFVIPRFIWPSKPETGTLGLYVGQVYFDRSETSSTSFTTPMAAVAFMYGGYFAVVVIMFSVGVLFGVLSRLLLVPALRDQRTDLLAVYTALSFLFPDRITQIIQFLIQQGLVLALLVWFLNRIQGSPRMLPLKEPSTQPQAGAQATSPAPLIRDANHADKL
jgi:hypothetical protein